MGFTLAAAKSFIVEGIGLASLLLAVVGLDSYAFNRKQKYFNKPQVKQPQAVG
jgi:hypothetical protein